MVLVSAGGAQHVKRVQHAGDPGECRQQDIDNLQQVVLLSLHAR